MKNNINVGNRDNSLSVLIVEDEIILALAIELSLKKMGFVVCAIVTSAQKAIAYAKEKKPNIILMDINLNKKETGIDAANVIWEEFKIPIVFLTSFTDDQTIKEAMSCEPYGYLVKPYRDEELKASLNIALHKHEYIFNKKEDEDKNNQNILYLEEGFIFDRAKSFLYKNDNKIELTTNEHKFFDIITKNPGDITPFETLYAYIWGEDAYNKGKFRTLLYRLRIKLGIDIFENMYERGYKIKIRKKHV